MRSVWLASNNLLQRERIRQLVGAGGPPVRMLGEAQSGDLVLVDLTAADALAVIGRVCSVGAEVLAYGPHKQGDLLAAAKRAGAHRVVANSALPGALDRVLRGSQGGGESPHDPQ